MQTLSLAEENELLHRELEHVVIELETLRATHAILRSEYAREHVLAEELAYLRAQCAQLRADRDTQRSISRQAITDMYLGATTRITTALSAAAEVTPARHIFENHITAEKTKGTECSILLTPLRDSASVTVSTTCGHIFDTIAFTTWNATHTECPVCRTPITLTYIF
jgi:hypothetical protein